MTYTDEDLEEAKKYINEQPYGEFRCDEVRNILARLEAAEAICELIALNTGWRDHAAIEIWRRTAGK